MGRWAKNRQKKRALAKEKRRQEATESGLEETATEAPKKAEWVRAPRKYDDIAKENEKFEKFYKLQKICPEDEWDKFMESLRSSLPVSFRVTGSRSRAKALCHIIKNKIIHDGVNEKKTEIETDIEQDDVILNCLPWYPEGLAWQINLTRHDVRRNENYYRLHNFLVSETESGNISRQESVSMIPPVVLGVEPHHKVLDLCAAPGSKTGQIIEMLHADSTKLPTGVIIANDIDNRRCYMLVHQAKRLQSPALIITNHDAALYPDLFITQDGVLTPLKFDRVLCDVPCSGDGTLRKNIDVWKKWCPSNALYLHEAQRRILKRGLDLLTLGGHLVYSTCSLNPLEDEAVIARVIRESNNTIELLDIQLDGLKYCSGVSTWVPMANDMVLIPTYGHVGDKNKSMLRSYHYPPTEEEAKEFKLEKCIRVLPHQQNTGGFFIALLRKKNALPWTKEISIAERIDLSSLKESDKKGRPFSKVPRVQGFNEDPYIFMTDEDSVWGPLRKFYNIDQSLDSSLFLTRSHEGKKRNIYFTTELVKNIVQSNENYAKIVNTGVKAFARCDNKWSPSDYRLATEGLPSLLSSINGRKINVEATDLISLLSNDEADKPPLISSLSAHFRESMKEVERGSFVILTQGGGGGDGPEFTIELTGWKGNSSVRAYVAANERVHYLRLLGADISKFDKNKFKHNELSEGDKITEESLNDEIVEMERVGDGDGDNLLEQNVENFTESTCLED